MSARPSRAPGDDPRIVSGACCVWWDTIHKVDRTPSGLPCCPQCGGVLFEVRDAATWWRGVDRHEADGHPGYRAFIEWMQGKCFADFAAAERAYAARG
jgi:hypothetical protein